MFSCSFSLCACDRARACCLVAVAVDDAVVIVVVIVVVMAIDDDVCVCDVFSSRSVAGVNANKQCL